MGACATKPKVLKDDGQAPEMPPEPETETATKEEQVLAVVSEEKEKEKQVVLQNDNIKEIVDDDDKVCDDQSTKRRSLSNLFKENEKAKELAETEKATTELEKQESIETENPQVPTIQERTVTVNPSGVEPKQELLETEKPEETLKQENSVDENPQEPLAKEKLESEKPEEPPKQEESADAKPEEPLKQEESADEKPEEPVKTEEPETEKTEEPLKTEQLESEKPEELKQEKSIAEKSEEPLKEQSIVDDLEKDEVILIGKPVETTEKIVTEKTGIEEPEPSTAVVDDGPVMEKVIESIPTTQPNSSQPSKETKTEVAN